MAAPNGLIVGWPSTAASITSGWSRYTTLDSRVPLPASSSITTTGGSDTHTHAGASHTHTDTHTHGSSTSSTYNNSGSQATNLGVGTWTTNHSHTVTYNSPTTTITTGSATGTSSSGSSLGFAYESVIWIQSNGTTDIPVGSVCWSNQATRPAGYIAHTNGINRFLRGATAAGDGGGTTAAATHTHTNAHTHTHSGSSHTHTYDLNAQGGSASQTNGSGSTFGFSGPNPVHTGTSGTGTGSGSNASDSTASGNGDTPEPLWYKLEVIECSSAAPAPKGVIALWTTTTPPSGWVACDGTLGTPNINGSGRYIKGASGTGEIGNTGGSSTHGHTITHSHGIGTTHTHASSTSANSGQAGLHDGGVGAVFGDVHNHTSGTSGASTGSCSTDAQTLSGANNDPANVNMFFIMSLGEDRTLPWWKTPRSNYVRR